MQIAAQKLEFAGHLGGGWVDFARRLVRVVTSTRGFPLCANHLALPIFALVAIAVIGAAASFCFWIFPTPAALVPAHATAVGPALFVAGLAAVFFFPGFSDRSEAHRRPFGAADLRRDFLAKGRKNCSGGNTCAAALLVGCAAALFLCLSGCAGAVQITARADSQGVQLTERINYSAALAALSSLLAPVRKAAGLPDFTLTPADAPAAMGLTTQRRDAKEIVR